jgi:ElaB/YqjD/DUF883 family membrane-anchored ribosome-binding protein
MPLAPVFHLRHCGSLRNLEGDSPVRKLYISHRINKFRPSQAGRLSASGTLQPKGNSKMATEAQIHANRENAQQSTGPGTARGKAASSRNALTIGLYTRSDYVRPEERGLYKEFCETLYSELNPEGLLEETFAAEITGASWRLRRCSAVEAELADYTAADPMLDESTEKARRSIDRARSHAHSLLNRSVNQLRRLQTERACRQVMNAVGDDGSLADYQQVVVAANNYEKGKHLHAKTREIRGNEAIAHAVRLASPGAAPTGKLASNCKPDPAAAPVPRNAPCPCQSGRKYKACCARTGAGWPVTKAA